MKRIGIEEIGYVGNLGASRQEVLSAMEDSDQDFGSAFGSLPVGQVASAAFSSFKPDFKGYSRLDRTAQLAMFAASQLTSSLNTDKRTMVAVGSSRGATETWERAYKNFASTGHCELLDSPLTTAGNLCSNVGNFLKAKHFVDADQSITCASGLRALADACAWINSGLVEEAVAGGSEAPLTDFTVAQMDALGILSKEETIGCRALDMHKTQNTMVLGEGAVMFHLSGSASKPLAYISGIGFATESGNSATGMTREGEGFQSSMQQAVAMAGWDRPDAIVAHAPGTIVGDNAEIVAVQKLFGADMPITSTKYKTGHMFGASGPMSVLMAVCMMNENRWVQPQWFDGPRPLKMKKMIVNAIGFGANAISLAIEID